MAKKLHDKIQSLLEQHKLVTKSGKLSATKGRDLEKFIQELNEEFIC